ncbi:DUF4012 domain-containing protein [Candidatus Dojkabacteria bacterium]|jgi:nucleoside-diphosphate-sugar epimerase|nr:DUF4012 domain-containing protein [Candidatus Dojkabacteria bacterium]
MKDVKKKNNFKGPISVLVHGSNQLSFGIAQALLAQGGKVIIVDNYNTASKKYITSLKEIGSADFVDFKGLEELLKNLPNVDYLFYFLNEYLTNSSTFASHDFLEETTRLNYSLKHCRDFNAKFSLITTVKLNLELSEHILNTKLSAPSPYSPIELQKYCETLVAEYRDKSKINARIIRVGTLLGSAISTISDPIVEQLIDEAVNKTFLTIKGEGLDSHYLLNIKDAIYGVLKLTFASKTEGEVITLANPNEYSTLSLAYKLLEINRDLLEIKFVNGDRNGISNENNYVPAPSATDFGWAQKVPLEDTLLEAISVIYPNKAKQLSNKPKKSEFENEGIIIKSKKTKTQTGQFLSTFFTPITKLFKGFKINFKNFKESLNSRTIPIYIATTIFLLALVYFLIAPLIGITISAISLYANAKGAYRNITQFEFEKASKKLSTAYNMSSKTEEGFSKIKWVFDVGKQGGTYDGISQLLFASEYAFSGAKDLTHDLIPLTSFIKEYKPAINFENDIPTSTQNYRLYLKELEQNSSSISKSAYDIQLASSLISNLDISTFPKLFQKYLVELKTTNENILNNILPAQKIISFLPKLLGVDGRVRYLVLFENPGEIRSTGGWLSSYGIVALDGGQVKELKVDDIYNAEGQLKIAGKYFDAPSDMKKALGISKWSVSLSNWSPSLSQTGVVAENFLSKLDPGVEFDGIITIDTEFLKSLLTKWDGITIQGETEKITAGNLDAKIYQLHTAFVPGQPVKSAFLANLGNEVLKKILTSDIQGYKDIAEIIAGALSQKHIQISTNNKYANDFFTENNWSGEIGKKYLSSPIPIEWNWGGNKANLFLERSYSLDLAITNANTINFDYEIFLQNKSTSNTYPQGEYKNYLRIYLPTNAQISSISGFVNNKYRIYNQNGFKVIGGWFNVPIRSTENLHLKYSLLKEAGNNYFPITTDGNGYTMDLNIFKQAGMGSDVYGLSIVYPDTWAIVTNTGLERGTNSLDSTFNLDTPKEFNIVWKAK